MGKVGKALRCRRCVACGVSSKQLHQRNVDKKEIDNDNPETDKPETPENIFFAHFPRNEDRCREWVRVLGDEDLVYVPIEKLCQNRFVCAAHFEPKQFNRAKSRLKSFAVPVLNMRREPLADDLLIDFPQHVYKDEVDDDVPSVPSPCNEEELVCDSPIDFSTISDHTYVHPSSDVKLEETDEKPVKIKRITDSEATPIKNKIKRFQVSKSTQTRSTKVKRTQTKFGNVKSTQTKCVQSKSTRTQATQTNCSQTKCSQTKCTLLHFLKKMDPS